jgi:hypothetical protein
MSKTDAPLRKFWSSWEEEVAAKLESLLQEETSRKGLPFKNISKAADFGAEELTKCFPDKEKPFHPGTLRRNEVYRSVLDQFVKEKSREVSGSERLKFKLELKRQSEEVELLQKQLSSALESRSIAQRRLSQSVNHNASEEAVEASFGVWLKLIEKLISEIEGARIDVQKRIVKDPLGEVGTLLTEKDFPEGFFDWLERNKR